MKIDDFMDRLVGEAMLNMLEEVLGEDNDDVEKATQLFRTLIRNGCPTTAIIKTLKELANDGEI